MKLKFAIRLLSITTTLLILILVSVSFLTARSIGQGADKNAHELRIMSSVAEHSRAIQSAFAWQVQEWKNILLRGNNQEQYQKHLTAFEAQRNDVQERLKALYKEWEPYSHLTADDELSVINSLIEQHDALTDQYSGALTIYNTVDPQAGKKVDAMIRGIDREFQANLQALADEIQNDVITVIDYKAKELSDTNQISVWIMIAGSAIIVILVNVLSMYIGNIIVNRIGKEPNELAKSFELLAKGDLTADIALAAGDQSSVAANAQLMQIRLRNIVSAIRNGYTETNTKLSKITPESEVEELQDAIKHAQRNMSSLNRAIDRFTV